MKRLLRHPATQYVLGWALTVYLLVILHTVRWRHENLACVQPVLAGETGGLTLLWHGRTTMCLSIYPHLKVRPTRAMISPSADGEFLAQALARVGCPAVRASSAKPGDSAKARAVLAAFRDAVAWVKGRGLLVVTPDGPRGPNEVIAPGSLQIARRSKAPVFLIGVAAAPALRLDTWDRAMAALPFGRGQVVWDGPHYVPAEAGEAEIEALAAEWSARLAAATRRAEALVGDRDSALIAPAGSET